MGETPTASATDQSVALTMTAQSTRPASMRTASTPASTLTGPVAGELSASLSSAQPSVSAPWVCRAIPWWPVSMWSAGGMRIVARTRSVTSPARRVRPCVGRTRVPRTPRAPASTTTPSARVTRAPEEMLSSELAVLDVRRQQELFRVAKLIFFHFSYC